MRSAEDVKLGLTAFINEYSDSKNNYWLPLCGLKKDIPNICFDLDEIIGSGDVDMIKNVFREMNISRINSYCADIGEYSENEPVSAVYGFEDEPCICPETFFFDDSEKWLVYVSHEWTICFTGLEIAITARKNIPDEFVCDYPGLRNGIFVCK